MIAFLALALAGPAHAGVFHVVPTILYLGAKNQSALFTVNNQGTEDLRFQVTSFAWDEPEMGEPGLDPTTDLVVFPTLFVVPAGTSQQIRVGTTKTARTAEQSYRIFVEELPPLSEEGTLGVRMLTKMGVPVFLEPKSPVVSGRIADATFVAGKLSLRVVNEGTVHFKIQDVQAAGLDAAGLPLFEGKQSGWYVLPGGAKRYELAVPSEKCKDIAKFDLKASTDQGVWTLTLPADPGQCLP